MFSNSFLAFDGRLGLVEADPGLENTPFDGKQGLM